MRGQCFDLVAERCRALSSCRCWEGAQAASLRSRAVPWTVSGPHHLPQLWNWAGGPLHLCLSGTLLANDSLEMFLWKPCRGRDHYSWEEQITFFMYGLLSPGGFPRWLKWPQFNPIPGLVTKSLVFSPSLSFSWLTDGANPWSACLAGSDLGSATY